MEVKVLIDNKKNDEKFINEWGLSLLIDFENKKILLDTGKSGDFYKNALILEETLLNVDYGVLSHAHYDHTDGLEKFFEINKNANFYVRNGFTENAFHKHFFYHEYIGIKKGLLEKFKNRFIYVDGKFELSKNVYLLGHSTENLCKKGKKAHLSIKINGKYHYDNFYHEQSLIFNTQKGLVIFSSCSHAGADNIINEVQNAFPNQKIYAIIGGFHLFCLKDEEIKAFASRLDSLGVEKIITGHCTGENAFNILKDILGNKVSQMYTGMKMSF